MNIEKVFSSRVYRDFRAIALSGFSSFLLVLTPVFFIENYTREQMPQLIVVSVLFLVIGLVSLRKFLWIINGTEILALEDDELIIEKKGSFLMRKKIICRKNIVEIRKLNASLDDNMSRVRTVVESRKKKIRRSNQLLLKIGGEGMLLILQKGNKKTYVFSDIEEGELNNVLISLNKWLAV